MKAITRNNAMLRTEVKFMKAKRQTGIPLISEATNWSFPLSASNRSVSAKILIFLDNASRLINNSSAFRFH